MVPTAIFVLLHIPAPPADVASLSVIVEPVQTALAPAIVPDEGVVFTVSTVVADTVHDPFATI